MTDFCITAIKYSSDRQHVEWVKINEEKVNALGPDRITSRAFVADLIRLGKATFQTRYKGADGKMHFGAQVHVVDGEFLSSDRNNTKRDNLGALPEFN